MSEETESQHVCLHEDDIHIMKVTYGRTASDINSITRSMDKLAKAFNDLTVQIAIIETNLNSQPSAKQAITFGAVGGGVTVLLGGVGLMALKLVLEVAK